MRIQLQFSACVESHKKLFLHQKKLRQVWERENSTRNVSVKGKFSGEILQSSLIKNAEFSVMMRLTFNN